MGENFSELFLYVGRLFSAAISSFRFLDGFQMPKWATTALGNLVVLIGALLLKHGAPVVGLVIVGFFVALQSVAILGGLVAAVASVTLLAGRRLGRTTEQVPPTAHQQIAKVLGGPLDVFSFLLFWV